MTNIGVYRASDIKKKNIKIWEIWIKHLKKIQLELDKLNKSYNARHGERREVE